MKNRQKKRNPQLAEAEKRGYEKGLKVGFENGRKVGVAEGIEIGMDRAVRILAQRWETLKNVFGIGPKTLQKIIDHMGKEYFESKVEKK